jgi:hypothetical protein
MRGIGPHENMRCGMLVRNFHRTSGNPASHATQRNGHDPMSWLTLEARGPCRPP